MAVFVVVAVSAKGGIYRECQPQDFPDADKDRRRRAFPAGPTGTITDNSSPHWSTVMTGNGGTPLVSVLTPVYNGGEFLEQCIESVLAQTFSDYEYIIVNNRSTDNTLDIARHYESKDHRIRVHNNSDFLGVMENHNLALSLMSPATKYCKIVCADDFIFPHCLEQMVNFADAHESVGMVGCYMLAGKKVMNVGLEYERSVVSGRDICRETLLGGPYVFGAPSSLLYVSDLIRKSTPFYPNSSPHADTSACYKWLRDCDFGFVHQVLTYTRIHPDSQTSRSIRFGTIIRAQISDLTQYGGYYLTPEELNKRTDELMNWYYSWLVRRIYEHRDDREFWDIQKAGLRDLGFTFSPARLYKTAALRAIREMGSPGAALRKVMRLKKSSKKIEAQYYD
jgi:glycosyltransferase involved in cell wall biosynthesis